MINNKISPFWWRTYGTLSLYGITMPYRQKTMLAAWCKFPYTPFQKRKPINGLLLQGYDLTYLYL